MRGKLQAAAAGAATALAIGAAPALAADRAEVKVGLGTQTPGAGATLKFDIVFRNPDDPNGKPPVITGGVYRLPEGTRVNTGAVPQCTASDDELRARGPSACPAESRVGSGTLTAVTGFGPPTDPVSGDVHVFNGPGQIIEVVTAPGTEATAGFDRLTVSGSNLIAHPPSTPGGPPDGQTAIKEIHLTIDRAGYATAPPTCDRRAGWAYGGSLDFADGSHAEVAHVLPCTAVRPALALAMQPRRVRIGRSTTFRFVVRSSDAACVRGAKVRFAGKRARTSVQGLAAITTRLKRAGTYRVSVSKRGCRTARGSVTATR
jgi:hypothetical protein